jgi:DUF2934 family protein
MPRRPGKTAGPAKTPAEPVEELIRRRAYEIHLERGSAHGNDREDWLRAEQEIRARQEPPAPRRKTPRKKN